MTTVSAFLARPLARLSGHSDHRPTSATFRSHDLAQRIDRDGIAAVDDRELATVVSAGRAAGASAVALDILADPAESRPARERAFGLVQVKLLQGRGVGFHLAA